MRTFRSKVGLTAGLVVGSTKPGSRPRSSTRRVLATAFCLLVGTTGAARAEKLVVGHQMLAMPRYGGSTTVTQMREEVRQWKDMGLDGVMLFDIGGLKGGGPQLAQNGLNYHKAGVAEGFKFAMSMTYFGEAEIQRYTDYVTNLADPQYAAARLFVGGKPYFSAYHGSQHLPQVVAALAAKNYPVYFEPMVFPRNFVGDYMTQTWESGYITSATPTTWNILYTHPTWTTTQGLAAFEIGKSIQDQVNQIDWIWNTAKAKGKTARGSIVAYYKGFAHKGNWMVYEGWGFTRLQQTFKRAIDSGIPAIEFITLNDFTESSYFNSWAANDPAIIVNHWNTFDLPAILDHSGFRYFSKRYIEWFKTGKEPAITQDELYYSYRLHPRDAADYHSLPQATKDSLQKWIAPKQPADWLYRKAGLPDSYKGWGPNYNKGIDWKKFSDGIHVAVRLKSPADVYINGVKVGDNLPAGEHLLVKPGEHAHGDSGLGYPLHTFGPSDFGFPHFEIRRDDETVLDHTGELEITPHAVPGAWNVLARKAPSAPSGEPAAVTATLTKPAHGSSVESGTNVSLSASTTGSVARVEFYSGATKIAETTSSPWNATWTSPASGNYVLKARAIDAAGKTYDSSSIDFTVNAAPVPATRGPFEGTRQTVPGRVELERYDEGGEAVAYHDDTASNFGGSFRSEGVDIQSNSDGHHVSFFSSGEWMMYSVQVETTARHRATIRVASKGAGGTFRIEIDGADVSGPLTVPDTLGWSTWKTITFEAHLTAGLHDLRVLGLTNGKDSNFIGNIDWIDLEPIVAEQPVPQPPTPVITSPTDGALFNAGVALTITTTLTGDISNVTSVEFLADSVVLAKRSSAPWTHTWSDAPSGTHTLTSRITVANGGSVTSDPVSIQVLAPAASDRVPYKNVRTTIPGTLELENYDEGGSGVAYLDNSPTNVLGAYRSDAVDIQKNAEGHNVGWFQAGEWLLFSIRVNESGEYIATARVSSQGEGGTFRVELDGVDISGPLQVPNTGGWMSWETISFETSLPSGDHDLRIVGLENTGGHSWSVIGNVDRLEFAKQSEPPAEQPALVPLVTAPKSGTILPAGKPVTINVGHEGSTQEQVKVDVFVNETLLTSSTALSFTAFWNPNESGDHFISARTTTASGLTTWSNVVDVSIQEPTTPPDLVAGSTVNVRDFGAVPDDNADDTSAIQDAIDAVGVLGGTVYLPAGVYFISPQSAGGDALKIAHDDLAVVGAGPARTILSFRTHGGADPATSWELVDGVLHRGRAIVIEGSAHAGSPRSNVSISSLRITGNAPATGDTSSPANVETGDGFDPSHVAIAIVSTTPLHGILLEGLELDNFRGGMIHTSGDRIGLIEIIDNSIHGSNGTGVLVSADVRMVGNDIHDHGQACVVATHRAPSTGFAQHGFYLHNVLEPRRNLTTNGLAGFVLRAHTATLAAQSIEPLAILFRDNTVQNALKHGVLVDTGLHGARIEANTFIDNGTSGDVRHGHITLAPGRSDETAGAVSSVAIRENSFASLSGADAGHALFLDSSAGDIEAVQMMRNTLVNAESAGGAIKRFLLLAHSADSNVSKLTFSQNVADTVALAVEDISSPGTVATRPRYSDNAVSVSTFVAGQNDYTNSGSMVAIHPSWSHARITSDRADATVKLSTSLDTYPDLTALHLQANASGHGFLLAPDAAWLRLTEPVTVAPGETAHLVKKAGRFEVANSAGSRGAPEAPKSGPAKTPLTVSLATPPQGQSITAGNSISLVATVSGNATQVRAVEFLVDGTRIHVSAAPPYSHAWTAPQPGSYLARARVLGVDGSAAASQAVVLQISAPHSEAEPSDTLDHLDIGAASAPGSTNFDAAKAAYSVSTYAAGLDDSGDAFRFTGTEAAGDAALAVRVAQFTGNAPAARAGVMMRGSRHPKSAFVAVTVSAQGGVVLSYRSSHGSAITRLPATSGALPVWLKLIRRGETFVGYHSADGASWSEIGRTSVALPFITAAGLCTFSGNAAHASTVTYEVFSLDLTAPEFVGEDIGTPFVSGLTLADPISGSHVLVGAGSDIWGRRDQFHFAHQSFSGDATVMARVEAIDAPHQGAKAGVMIRASMAADAQHVLLSATPGHGLLLQWRGGDGAITQSVSKPGIPAPVSLALEREGGQVHAYFSSDGKAWQRLETVTITLPSTCDAGMAATSRTQAAAATVRFSGAGVVY